MHNALPVFLPRSGQTGFSMVELAVVIAILGLMTWAASASFGNAAPMRDRARALQIGETLREALRAFALRNGHLPCPDTAGAGWENRAAPDTLRCATDSQFGWLPYRTLGLDLPADPFRVSYAVYRQPDNAAPASDADLSARMERSTPLDPPGAAGYRNTHDLIVALNTAAAQTAGAPSSSRPYLTGDNGVQGVVNCATNVRNNPAFWLVLPVQDRDGSGTRFDGIHAAVTPAAIAAANSLCAHAPGAPAANDNDDIVLAEPLTVLAGWLQARAP